jgi:hypothetical protein
MTTFAPSQQLDWLMMESPSMSSAADSLAKTSASQAKAQDLPERDQVSGGNSTGSSPKSARRGSSSKTYRPFDIKDWEMSCGPSLRSGTMRSGTVFPLPPLAPLTAGTESGLWPTPTANSSNQCSVDAALKEAQRLHPQGRWTLMSQVAAETVHGRRMWPTPTAVWRPMEGNVRLLREKVIAGEMTEEEATQMLGKSPFEAQGKVKKMWPTPDASPHKYRLTGDSQQSRSLNGIHGGKLNPMWVEWLMGFPLDWTDLKR